uniref:cation:proton antiporter domain-containing protein n=1 Tax=Intrasporangium sp. TaxID=1925024 RepID=UPI003221728D
MDVVVLYVAVVFGCGLLARLVTMPPLVGFVAAGFVLNVMHVPELEELSLMSEIGVTLMLFAIGLRLDLRTLLGKEVWLTAGAHILLMTVVGAGFLAGLGALGAFGPESLRVLAAVALVLSFSSTIFVVKILQDRGDEQAFYGNICIGVLIIQDIVAVAVISVSRGQPPSLYSLGLVAVIPALAWVTKGWYRLGHGELGALFGIAMALIPGYALFEWLGLSGSLGALVMGLILAPRPGSDQLSHTLFTVKELLLVGFFVSIGFQGLPTMENVRVGLLLVLLLPVQAVLYWFLLWLLGLRNRTSVLTSLLL